MKVLRRDLRDRAGEGGILTAGEPGVLELQPVRGGASLDPDASAGHEQASDSPTVARVANASTQIPVGSFWICSDANRFTGCPLAVAASSQVMVPQSLGRSTVWPGASSSESVSESPPVCWVRPPTSRVYTERGVPSSMPRSPLNTLRVRTGLIRSG